VANTLAFYSKDTEKKFYNVDTLLTEKKKYKIDLSNFYFLTFQHFLKFFCSRKSLAVALKLFYCCNLYLCNKLVCLPFNTLLFSWKSFSFDVLLTP
jgi:hypothetical protein